jgi:hypothetical protein
MSERPVVFLSQKVYSFSDKMFIGCRKNIQLFATREFYGIERVSGIVEQFRFRFGWNDDKTAFHCLTVRDDVQSHPKQYCVLPQHNARILHKLLRIFALPPRFRLYTFLLPLPQRNVLQFHW